MKKVIEFIKWPLTFPVWAMVALYLFWILSVPIEFVDLEAYILGVIILCIYLVATILIKTFYKREYLSIGLWILLVPLMLVSTLVTLWFVFESIKYFDLLSRGNREFTSYVLGMLVLSIYPAKMLFRKNDAKNRMMQFLLGLNILLFLSGNLLYYVFFHPATLEKAILGNYRYVVADEFDLDFHSHLRFYKCERWSYSCETLYTSNWFLGEPKIIVDEKENEVSLMGGERILYTDGKIRRTYRNTEEQLNNKLYLVAENYKCNNVEYLECETDVYTLYECNLDYRSCTFLPIRYTKYENYLYLEADQEKNEIRLMTYFYDKNGEEQITHIFTYGENPQCYVEDCEILDE